jgi:hypothetical protein
MLGLQDLSINDDVAAVEADARKLVETGAALGARYLQAGITVPLGDKVVAATAAAQRICRDAGMDIAMEFLPFLPLASIGQTRDLLDAAGMTGISSSTHGTSSTAQTASPPTAAGPRSPAFRSSGSPSSSSTITGRWKATTFSPRPSKSG